MIMKCNYEILITEDILYKFNAYLRSFFNKRPVGNTELWRSKDEMSKKMKINQPFIKHELNPYST